MFVKPFLGGSYSTGHDCVWGCAKAWSNRQINSLMCPFVVHRGRYWGCAKAWSNRQINSLMCPVVVHRGR